MTLKMVPLALIDNGFKRLGFCLPPFFFDILVMGYKNPVTWREFTRVGTVEILCAKKKRKKGEIGYKTGSKNVHFYRTLIPRRDGSNHGLHSSPVYKHDLFMFYGLAG